ncbi:MAG: response regulator [Dysgonamonadaceae bacterium]|jgi:signal transduction histidine kinase/CheY-like chemotaxis protein/HPt (histidine-containing phosphotransfer) domain-containing protein|nr:response regulator [Dysgonamonadaceae bacterium]
MKITESLSSAKTFIVAGYILVMAIMIVGLVTIYNNLRDFSEQKMRDENRSELIIVGNTISKLYEMENSQNLFSSETALLYFSKYDSILPSIERNLDSLKILSTDSLRIHTLDSIGLLLSEKNKNLKEIAVLIDSIHKAPFVEQQTAYSLIPNVLNEDLRNFLESKNINRTMLNDDTTVVKGQRKGLFSRLGDAIAGKADSTIVVNRQPILQETEFKLVVDTVINMVRVSERLNFARQRELQQILFRRQTKMTDMNNMLTDRINHLLTVIEIEEYNKYVQLLQNKNAMLVSSQRTIYFASMLAVLIAMAFGIVSLLNINRNFRYRKQLEESNRRISDLLDSRQKLMLTISHDIKAPMGSILGYTELMEGDVPPQKKELYLENMRQSGEHILQLLGNLLNYHKLESGTWLFKEINFNVHDLVEVTALSFEPAALRKKLAFSIENGIPKHFFGFGDAYVMRQVMGNLVSNAIKYTPSGSVCLKASIEKGKGAAHFLRFSVRDTGPGIDEEERNIIFREFYQLKTDNPDHFGEGCGLGLAITRGLVQELNGELSLESEKGRGAKFSVLLPIQQAKPKNDYDFTNLNVLLMDDDPILLTMAAEMLKLKGARVSTETNPENTLTLIAENRFDIVFVDMQMPGISGFKLADTIRESGIAHCLNLPIIILSANTLPEQTSGDESYTAYLTKPFSSHTLYETIHKHTAAARQKPQSRQSLPAEAGGKVEKLIDFVKDDTKAVAEILRSFVAESTANIDKLQQALDTADAPTASSLAHKMIPVFQMMGDSDIVEVFTALEKGQRLPEADTQRAVALVRHYLSEAEKLRNHLSTR